MMSRRQRLEAEFNCDAECLGKIPSGGPTKTFFGTVFQLPPGRHRLPVALLRVNAINSAISLSHPSQVKGDPAISESPATSRKVDPSTPIAPFSNFHFARYCLRITAMASLSKEERLALIKENLEEHLNIEIIEEILAQGRDPKIYWGKFARERVYSTTKRGPVMIDHAILQEPPRPAGRTLVTLYLL